MVEASDKSMMRAVMRRVHPDLFASHPYEGAQNSESLKALNSYVDSISQGRVLSTDSKTLVFYVKNESTFLQKVEAELPANGSLGPLFYAFGLITREQLLDGMGSYGTHDRDTNFVQWLQETVQDAVRTADYHDSLKSRIRELRTTIEAKFGLGTIQLGGEYALGSAEQLQQIDALKVLDTALTLHEAENGNPVISTLSGLNLRLYHPDVTPFDTYICMDASGSVSSRTGTMQSHIGDDGVLHLVANRATIRAAIRSFDLDRARLLTRLSRFWLQRVESLTPSLLNLLHVDKVWADTRNEVGSQKFVLWAGALLGQREEFERLMPPGQCFSFSILVHCDATGPMVEFLAASCVLQVRADSPPRLLLEFLQSEAAKLANLTAASASSTREIEERLLENVRDALGAKHVIRVCSMLEQDKVLDGARRLLDNAASISQAVDLTGASIALDDCYEVWESGFISIPYDFRISDLEPQLRRLLGSSTTSPWQPAVDEDTFDYSSGGVDEVIFGPPGGRDDPRWDRASANGAHGGSGGFGFADDLRMGEHGFVPQGEDIEVLHALAELEQDAGHQHGAQANASAPGPTAYSPYRHQGVWTEAAGAEAKGNGAGRPTALGQSTPGVPRCPHRPRRFGAPPLAPGRTVKSPASVRIPHFSPLCIAARPR